MVSESAAEETAEEAATATGIAIGLWDLLGVALSRFKDIERARPRGLNGRDQDCRRKSCGRNPRPVEDEVRSFER